MINAKMISSAIALLLLSCSVAFAAPANGQSQARLVQGTFDSAADEQAFQRALAEAFGGEVRISADDGASQDSFGISVALSGGTALVGASRDDTPAGLDAGSAYIFTRDGTAWTQQAKLTASDGADLAELGRAVALAGDTALVGAAGNENIPVPGSAYVFTRSGTTWAQQAKLTASDGANVDRFGHSVALSGEIALVGAVTDDTPAGVDVGSAYIFSRSGTGWSQQAKLTAGDGAAGNFFGISVALAGDTALVGAPRNATPAGAFAGSAYVFARTGAVWTQQAKLTASDGALADQLGFSVALSGDTALVGAVGVDTPAGADLGAVYVFTGSGSGWAQQAKLTAGAGPSSGAFGRAVTLSGDTALVGASQENTPAGSTGAAYVFARSGTAWSQQAQLTASDGVTGLAFGSSVALSGDTALVGALGGSAQPGVSTGLAYIYARAPSLTLNDANRFGDASSPGVGGVAVTLTAGSQSFGPVTTNAQGGFSFAPTVDLNQFYDLRLVGLGLNRVYQAIQPATLLPTSLVLPLDLRTRLDSKLLLLEATSPLVLRYDTTGARTLLLDWNVLQPELGTVHRDRDRALGRLLTASEGLAGLYADTHPLSMESAKVTVDLVTSFLTVRKLLADLNAAAARQAAGLVAQGTFAIQHVFLALQLSLKAAELAMTYVQDSIIDAIRSVLPEWGEDQLGQGIDITTKGVLGAFESGSWSNVAGREGLLGGLVEVLIAEVGGRVISTAYVAKTQTELDLSTTRSRTLVGSGSVNAAFAASQQHAAFVNQRNGEVLALSEAVSDTAKQWNIAADLFLLIGESGVPLTQIVATAGTIVKAMSVGGLAGAGIVDYTTIFKTAFDDAPVVAGRAYDPGLPPPAISASTMQQLKSGAALAVVPSEYLNRLATLKQRVTANDRPGAIAEAQALLAADATTEAAIGSQMLRLLALTASSSSAPLASAQRATLAAAGVLGGERITVYAMLAGYVIPPFAQPGATDADLTAQIDRVTSAINAFESAVAQAESAAAGITAGPFLVVADHGLVNGGVFGHTAPGAIQMRARIVNAGQQASQGVIVGFAFRPGSGPVPTAVLTSPSSQTIGTLAPGESRTLTWNATATDTSARGTGAFATYEVLVSATNGRTDNADGGFEVLTALDVLFANGFEQ